jgi:hypothetical protein
MREDAERGIAVIGEVRREGELATGVRGPRSYAR